MFIPIIYTGSFPYGDASANRILSYAVEMAKFGHEVQVMSLVTYDQPFTDKEREDLMRCSAITYRGINVHYVSGADFWPREKGKKVRKLWLYLRGIIRATSLLNKRKGDYTSIMTLSSSIFQHFWFSYVAKKNHVKLIIERAELPSIEQEKSRYEKSFLGRLLILLTKKAFKKPDAWILETQHLVDYYIPLGKPNCPYLIVPMTVDIAKYSEPTKTFSPYSPYIAYCGNMSEADGISILIKAFSFIADKFPSYKLVLAGDSSAVPAQKQLVSDMGLDNRVVFLGRISSETVPQFLKNASLLVLASPTSIRSTTTMPCKVGEYLCTGNPVVVTNLGEIPKYLTDGVSAFLPEPDSPEQFALGLEKAMNTDKDTLISIGKEGYKVAEANFNSAIQTKRIVDFLIELAKK
ncbi:MAG TPA: glycosyltransferase [Bacteroidales bacterium]|jgi:glycosyltransferase involved in cell wall biosynthesis|nr:glycosyltransferase [Bacteroidales bacterium]